MAGSLKMSWGDFGVSGGTNREAVFILKQQEKVEVFVFFYINNNSQNNFAHSGRVKVICLLDRRLRHIPYWSSEDTERHILRRATLP